VFEILNGKYGEDTKSEFAPFSQIGKSVVDYALMSEGLLLHVVEWKQELHEFILLLILSCMVF
jgi:hypothetical protein